MKWSALGLLAVTMAACLGAREDGTAKTYPLPENYREWVWLSSGLGMAYTAEAGSGDSPSSEQLRSTTDSRSAPKSAEVPLLLGGAESRPVLAFDNVFASPEAYKAFKTTGTWPVNTVLILEVRKSGSNSSINKSGHFQLEREDIEAHVKDGHGNWAFYGFGNGAKTGRLIPKQASCYSCHEQHGLVDTTFVQFYPTLLEFAKAKGTVHE